MTLGPLKNKDLFIYMGGGYTYLKGRRTGLRLSKEQYATVAQNIKTMREIFWDTFLIVNGKFPKNDKTMRSFWDMERALSRTYYQMEREFFKDFPKLNLKDYRGEGE